MNAEEFYKKNIEQSNIPKEHYKNEIITMMEDYHQYKAHQYRTLKKVVQEEEQLSCCGDILDPDFPICPTCLEHC